MVIPFGRTRFTLRRGIGGFLIMLAALVAFEMFNFSTTEYALATFFGGHDALGMASWATVLSIAFCGIDFAGLSSLFTPQTDWRKEPKTIWMLTGAWFLGAAMNAIMTWWAVTSALSENPVLGNELVSRQQILEIVPVFVAALVWLTRVMLIGSIATTGDHVFGRQRPAVLDGAMPRQHRAVPKPEAAARPGSLPGRQPAALPHQPTQPTAKPAAAQQSNRASTVRSYPRPGSSTSGRYDRVSQPSAAASRGGMPIGSRGYQIAQEMTYVDLE
jgi:hypothetical protein